MTICNYCGEEIKENEIVIQKIYPYSPTIFSWHEKCFLIHERYSTSAEMWK